MRQAENELTRLVRSVAEPMGYELVGVEYFQRGTSGAVLRVFIDHDNGITLDDCSAVSHQLSGVLDVEDPISGHFNLEVSSPGLDRPLFTAEHFERFRGERARIKLAVKIDDRRKLEGLIEGVQDGVIRLSVEGEMREIPLAMVDSAHLVPEY